MGTLYYVAVTAVNSQGGGERVYADSERASSVRRTEVTVLAARCSSTLAADRPLGSLG